MTVFKALYIFRNQQNEVLRCFVAFCQMSRFTRKSALRLPKIEGEGGSANLGNARIQTTFFLKEMASPEWTEWTFGSPYKKGREKETCEIFNAYVTHQIIGLPLSWKVSYELCYPYQ